MPSRIINGVGAIALLACLAWWLGGHTDPVVRSAEALRGERWYRLVLDDAHVGYLHTRTRRDALGRWHFHSDLRFVLSRGNPVRIEEHLHFAATPPYPLVEARHRSNRAGRAESTVIQARGPGYQVQRSTDAANRPEQIMDESFLLADHLSFETWLRGSQPPAGATVTARALDFDRRTVVNRRFTVKGRNSTGYQISNPAPLDATFIQLDQRLRPVTMTLSGLFQLEHTSREQALAPRTALQAASYFVPTDRRLPNHTEIRSLALEVNGAAGAADLWPALSRDNVLRRQAGSVSSSELNGEELSETGEHPVGDQRIRALAQRATAGTASVDAQVDALVRFVHDYIRYEEGGRRRHVLELLETPRGDCSEYADLLTTLARSLNIPSRTVFGLAYADSRPPAFRFHAWNEVRVDGAWRVVDPTWNQLQTDATHIPLPSNVAHALELLTGGLDLSFTVRDVEYY